jgi:hypothetical protein
MAREAHRELSFEVPDDWEDKSITAFAPRRDTPIGSSVTITRELNKEGKALRALAASQLATVAKSFPGFELKQTRDGTVGGLAAIVSDFTWQGDTGSLAQRHVLVIFKQWIYAITFTQPKAEADKGIVVFEKILSTVAFPS